MSTRSALSPDRVAQAVVATVLAGVVGYFAIIWLTKIVRSGKIWYFSVYLVVLAAAILVVRYGGAESSLGGRRRLSTRVSPHLLAAAQAVLCACSSHRSWSSANPLIR